MDKCEYMILSVFTDSVQELNKYGDLGWELVCTTPSGQVILKRRKQ